MTFSVGQNAHLAYSPEVTPGTRVVPAIALPLIDESMEDSGSKPIWHEGIIKGRRTHTGYGLTKSDVGGSVKTPLTAESIRGLLLALMGTGAPQTGTGPFVDVFTPGPLPSFSMQIGWEDSAETAFRKDYLGCMMGGATLDVRANQHPTMTWDIKALSEHDDDYAAITPSYASLTYFEFSDFVLDFDGGSSECFDTASIVWDNGLYQSPAICPSNPRATVYEDGGRQMVTGTIGQDFAAFSKYAKFAAGTAATLQVTATAGTSILDIAMAIVFTGETPKVQGPGRIKQGLPFEIQSGTSDATAITVTLTSSDEAP